MNLKPINTLQDMFDYLTRYPINPNIRFVLRRENILLSHRNFVTVSQDHTYYVLNDKTLPLRAWSLHKNTALSQVLDHWGIQMLIVMPTDSYNVALLTGDVFIPTAEILDEDALPF